MASTDPSTSASASATAAAAQQQQQVPLTLKTSIPDLALLPTQYLVPTSFSRSHLSTLVNRLLSQTSSNHTSTIPFDFVVDGQLLRESLDSWLDRHGKTVEEGIELEYIRSTLPPKWAAAFQHDDWVASIDAAAAAVGADTFLTTSYDSCFRLYSYSNPAAPLLTHRVPAQGSAPQSLVDARWVVGSVQANGNGNGTPRIATAGLDGAVRVFDLPAPQQDVPLQDAYTSQPPPKQAWYGLHTASASGSSSSGGSGGKSTAFGMQPSALTSVASSHDGTALLSASRDGSIAYWKLDSLRDSGAGAGAEEDDAGRKRRKAHNGKAASSSSSSAHAAAKAPTALLWHAPPSLHNGTSYVPAPNARVSRALFARNGGGGGGGGAESASASASESAFSASHNGSIMQWDLFAATQGGNAKVAHKTSDRVILCMDQMAPRAAGDATLATGHMDRSLGVWDMRAHSANISLLLPAAHAAPVYALAAHPDSHFLLASADAGGVVKLFDTRSPKRALFSLQRPAEGGGGGNNNNNNNSAGTTPLGKLLAAAWDPSGQVVLAAGEDCRVDVYRGEGIGRE